MKKHLLLSAALVAVSCASVSATVTIEGSETEYATISAAVAAAESGATILVTDGCNEINPIAVPTDKETAKTITIKGVSDNEIVVTYGGINVVSSANKDNVLSIENITFRYTGSDATGRASFAIGRGSIALKNVNIENANIVNINNNTNGVIMLNNGNSNIPNAEFDNVKIVDSNVEVPAQVVVNNSNVSLSGDTELSIQLKGTNFIKDASGLTGHVTLVLDSDRATGSAVVKGCTDPSLFTISGVDGMRLKAVDGNLVLAEIPAIENVTTGAEYTSLSAAVSGSTSGDVIMVYQDQTISNTIRLNGRTLTVKGANPEVRIIRDGFPALPMFVLNYNKAGEIVPADTLTLENIVLDGNNVECTSNVFQPAFDASLTLNNVKIQNCVTTAARGLIDNNGNNPGTWHLNGVIITDCTVPNQEVTANSDGNTIAGNNSFTLRIADTYKVDAEGVDNEMPISVTIGNLTVAKDDVVITNCPSDNQFVCANDGYHFSLNNGNLVLHQTIYTGIDNIEAATEGDAKWYNLRGEAVVPSAPGVYIVRRGSTVAKVYVR